VCKYIIDHITSVSIEEREIFIQKYKPKLFIEIHGVDVQRKIENVQRVVEFLIAREYSIYHVES
jgi:hypothetical protein